jgi:outer membrane immunogenic protein
MKSSMVIFAPGIPSVRRPRATNIIWVFGFAALSAVASERASAGDFAANAYQPSVVAPAVPVVSWTGWYFGANAGFVDSKNELNTVSTPTPDAALGAPPGVSAAVAALTTGTVPVGNLTGFIGGGQIGYNWQFGALVTGLETDIQGLSGLNATDAVTKTTVIRGVAVSSTETATMDTRFLGTARGRLGFLATPTLFVYGTGGLAYGDVDASISLLQVGTIPRGIGAGTGSLSEMRAGWTAGGGVEWKFAQNWSAKLEYLHYDLGTVGGVWSPTSSLPPLASVYQTNVSSARFDGDLVRAGVNFHF